MLGIMKVRTVSPRQPAPGPRRGWTMPSLLPLLLLLLLADSAFTTGYHYTLCEPGFIQCASSDTCITKTQLCDGTDDCAAMEDESEEFCDEYLELTDPCPEWKVVCLEECVTFLKACNYRHKCGFDAPSLNLCWTMTKWKISANYVMMVLRSGSLRNFTPKRRPDLNSTTGFKNPIPNAAFNIAMLKENPPILQLRDSSPRKEGDKSRPSSSRIRVTPSDQDEAPLIRATPLPQRRFALSQAVAGSNVTLPRQPASVKLSILQFINRPIPQTLLTASDVLSLQTSELFDSFQTPFLTNLQTPALPTSPIPELLSLQELQDLQTPLLPNLQKPVLPTSPILELLSLQELQDLQTPVLPTSPISELLSLQELQDLQTRTSSLLVNPTTAGDDGGSVLPPAGLQPTADHTLPEPSCCDHCLRCARSSSCIAHTQICDGVGDCPAEEDENPDLCKHFPTESCPVGLASCDSSCIPWASACAGHCREQVSVEACYVVLKRQIPASLAQESHQEDMFHVPQDS